MQNLVSVMHFCTLSCTSMSPLVLLCSLSSFKLDRVPTCLLCLPLAPGVLQLSVSHIDPGRVRRVTTIPLLGQVRQGNDGDKNLDYMLTLCSAQARPSFSLAAKKSGRSAVHQRHWPLEGTSVLLPPLQRFPFTLSAFKGASLFFPSLQLSGDRSSPLHSS